VLISDSAGTEAALLIASYEPHLFDAIVANSPTYLVHGADGGSGASWTFHGKPLTPGALIPVADIRVPVLLSDGGQDVDSEAIRLGEVDRDELDTGLHERRDEVDVAGEAIELGDD